MPRDSRVPWTRTIAGRVGWADRGVGRRHDRKPSAFPVRARAAHIRRRVRGRLGPDGDPPRHPRSGRRRFRRSAGAVAPARRRRRASRGPSASSTGAAGRSPGGSAALGPGVGRSDADLVAVDARPAGRLLRGDAGGGRGRAARPADVARRDRADRRQGGGDAPGDRHRTRRAGPARGAPGALPDLDGRGPRGRAGGRLAAPTGPTRSTLAPTGSRTTCSRSSSRAARRARRRA